MVNPMIGDRDATWRNVNFYRIMSIAYHKIAVRHYFKERNNLVGDVFHQLLGVCHANGLTGIIHADDEFAALRIGKAANPLQVLVVPRLLELYRLCFLLHLNLLNLSLSCEIISYRSQPWLAALERAQDFLPFLPRRFPLISGQRFNLHLAVPS